MDKAIRITQPPSLWHVFVVGLGIVIAATRTCPPAPCNMTCRLRYTLLIFYLCKLVLKLEFLSSRHCFSLYIYHNATNNLCIADLVTSIMPITWLK
jgi:hypothetical protein